MSGSDISQLLQEIKEGIATIEIDGPDRDVLTSIERDFIEMLELIKLSLISLRDTYYGYFLMNMRFLVDFASDGIAGIRLGEYPPLFVSNPLLLCKFSLKEIIYVVCHEIDHVVLNHPAEMLKANPSKDPNLFKLFNLAADASVNDRLDKEVEDGSAFMKAPAGVVNSDALGSMFGLKHLLPLESYQYYYGILLANNVEPDESGPQRMLARLDDERGDEQSDGGAGADGDEQADGDGDADGGGSGGEEDSSQDGDVGDGGTGDGEEEGEGGGVSGGDERDDGAKVVTAAGCKNPSDHEWGGLDGLDAEEMGYVVREFINSAVDLMNDETRGLMPAGFMERVELMNEPPRISWQSLLKQYVGTISAGKRKTRSRLNRRQQRFDLSGAVNDKTLKIVVAIDTSGSMSDDAIASVFNEIFAIIAHRKFEMTVIECDAMIHRVYRVRSREDVELTVRGRGGTSFTPVIEFINGDRHFRDALLIYFTDGYGEYSIPKPLTYRNLWVLTEGDYLSLEEPYGAVISMEQP